MGQVTEVQLYCYLVLLSAGIQSAGDSVPETLWVPILHSAEEDNLSPFDSKIACLCQSIEINNKHVYRQSQVQMPNGSGVEWAECSLIIATGCRVQVFSLILDSLVGLSAGIQSAGDSVPETLWVPILHSAEEDNLSPFDSKIACLCQSIEINNKHVYRQNQVQMPNGSGVEWAECSLIIVTGCRVQVFSLILDSLVGLSAGIQSAGDSIPETLWVPILHSAEEDNLSPFDSKITCLCQSIEINNKLIAKPGNKTAAPSWPKKYWAGLCFSRPKPVFPVQNGINWDKLVFPSFSRPKLGKTVQNWEKLCRTIKEKVSKNVILSNKNWTRHTRNSFHTYCSYDLWTHNPNLMNSNFCRSSSNIVGSNLSS